MCLRVSACVCVCLCGVEENHWEDNNGLEELCRGETKRLTQTQKTFFYYTNIYMNIFTVGVLFYELECENRICLFLTGLLNGGKKKPTKIYSSAELCLNGDDCVSRDLVLNHRLRGDDGAGYILELQYYNMNMWERL